MDWNRIFNAALAFVRSLIVGIAVIVALEGKESLPDVNDWRGWVVLVCLALNSSVDKYSTSTRPLALNREILTEEQRRLITGAAPKRPAE